MRSIKSPQNWKKKLEKKRRQTVKKYQKSRVRVKQIKFKKKNGNTFLDRLFKSLLKLAVWLIILGVLFCGFAFAWFSKELPKSTDLLTKKETQAAKFYDRTGEHLLYDLGSGEFARTKIKLEDMPDYVKWATLVSEDKKFYSHHGIDFKGILRSVFINIFKRAGSSPIGGSSISQQFIKNALLSPEKTYTRKFKELILTWQLERRFSKDEILEMYLNEIPYGGTAYGIEAASKKYFSKSAKELNLQEAACLAALPQAPSYLSPYGSNRDKLLWRKDWILDSLAEEGYISKQEAESVKKQELRFSKIPSSIIAPHFVFYVKEQIAEKYGESALTNNGLKIITSLDFEKQKTAEDIILKQTEKNLEKYNANNAALVSLDSKTGEILVMVGSKDYFDEKIDGAVNVALSPRQPGSSFKPIVYATAFTKGYSPDTILFDLITTFKTEIGDYEPHNYGDKNFGPVSIRKAIAGSLNIPAVKTIYLVGINNVLDLAEKLGYRTFKERSRFGLSLVLGGGEVKLLEHTAAFTVFSQDGKYFTPQGILKIENQKGKILEEFNPRKIKGKEVLDEQIARQITNILSDNKSRSFVFGEQNYLTLKDRPVAVKTGTTNDFKDGWTIGYTPQIVTGVWVGNTRGEAMKGTADGSNVAAPIWNSFMNEVHVGLSVENFNEPKKQELPEKPMLNGQVASEIKVKIDKITGKLATELTPNSQIEEKTFREVHSILHYVNKNNPLGPIPDEPWQDENYTNWELVVQKWAKENDYETQIPIPTEKDDVHTKENIPELEIISPNHNTILTSMELSVEIKTNSKRGVVIVEYWLDNIKLTTLTEPFNLTSFQLIGFENGQHILKVIAKDDVENQKEETISLSLNLGGQYSQPTTFIQPKLGDVLVEELFPYPIILNIANPEYYEKVDVYITNSSGNSKWIDWSEIKSSPITLTWEDVPEAGNYKIYVLTTNKNHKGVKSEEVEIKIK